MFQFHRILLTTLFALVNAAAFAQTSGLTNRQPIGAYLNGIFPATSPGSGGGYAVEDAFPGVTFFDAIKMVQQPNSSILWIITRQGQIWRMDKNAPAATKTLMLDIGTTTLGWGDSGMLGIALHPQFGQAGNANRGYLYVWYNHTPNSGVEPHLNYNRLSRFTVADGANAIAKSSELIMINQFDEHEWHNGGDIFFGPDGFLYLTVGDEGELGEPFNNAQKINDGLFSGVLRIDVNQDATRSHPIRRQPQVGGSPPSGWPATYTQGYYIPNDNPWLDAGGSVLEEFYAIGLRSPHRMSFDAGSGKAFIGDVGQDAVEELDVLAKGANYQWSYLEGNIAGPKTKPASIIGTETPPIYTYPHGNGESCIIGGYVYRGSRLAGSLLGKYIFGDYVSGKIRAFDWQTPGATPSVIAQIAGSTLTGFSVDSSNELYLMQLGREVPILKLSPAGGTAQPPATLSATGAFSSLANLTPASGIIPYSVNSPLWTDGALKQRWIALPNDGAPYSGGEVINFTATGSWNFPVGTVLIKQFDLATNEANPSVRRRIETRFLVRGTDSWYGVTYKWRADGSDADLLSGAENMSVTITTAAGGTRTQNWTFPGRGDCLNCHSQVSGWVLGPNTRQLNGNVTYPTTGITANQLATWNAIGMFDVPLSSTQIAGFAKTVPVNDTTASVETRARSYIDSNCSHCHRPGGVRANWDGRFDTPFANANIINGPLFNDLGVAGAKEVSPGDLSRSMMHIRLNSLTDIKMPPLAKNVVDTEAVTLIANWINSLGSGSTSPQLAGSDVGDTGAQGSTSGTAATGTYTVKGSGSGIYGTADAFQYAAVSLTGDGEIRARVAGQTNTDGWAKAGVMVRESLAQGSRHAVCFLTPENGFGYEFRATTSQPSDFIFGPASNTAPNNWVRMVRSGNSLIGYSSADGQNWTLIYTGVVPSLQSTVYIGLIVTSSSWGALSTATFDNVKIIGGSPTANRAPVVAQPANQTSERGAAASLQVSASDPDGNALTYSAVGLPAGLSISSSTGLISGTVSTSAAATSNVTVTATDGSLSDSEFFVWSTVDPQPPGTTLTSTDIGAVGVAGSSAVNAGTYTVNGSGSNIYYTADSFRFAFTTLNGDGEIKARVTSQTNTAQWAKAGVMIRETLTAGSRHAMMYVTPYETRNGFEMLERTTTGGFTTDISGPGNNPPPNNWVRLVRAGDTITGYASLDGSTWTQVHVATYSGLPATMYFGLAVSSVSNSTLGAATFDNVRINASNTLTSADIGAVGVAGSTSLAGSVYTVRGSGSDIYYTADSFRFAYASLTGDGEIKARITSQTNTASWAKAGVMIRETLTTGSRHALMYVTPYETRNGFEMLKRTTTGGATTDIPGPANNAPPNNWVRLVRTGDTIIGYASADGANWTQVHTATYKSLPSTMYFGLAVASVSNATLGTVTFDNVQITGAPATGGTQLVGADIGSVGVAGSTALASGVYTVKGSGSDIYYTADSFHFAYTRISGDGEIKARVTSQTNTAWWAKAAVMMRESLATGSRHGTMYVTPNETGNGYEMLARTSAGASTTYYSGPGNNPPPNNWLRLVRSGNTITGYASANGTSWTQVSAVTYTTLPTTMYFGLAVSSVNNTTLGTATFDNVQITGTPAAAASQNVTNTLTSLDGTDASAPAYPSSWSQWSALHPSVSSNQDGDYNSDLMEYALGEDPTNGATAGGLQLAKREDGRWAASFRRPSAVSDLTFALETSADLVSWSALPQTPITTDSADGFTTVTYAALDALLSTSGDATVFVRLRVTHRDANASATGEPLSLQRVSFAAGSQTAGWANVMQPLFAGRAVAVNGTSVLLPTPIRSAVSSVNYYLEVRDGTFAGHRFDISAFTGSGVTLDMSSTRSTQTAVPNLAGAVIVIRPQVTLNDVLDKSTLLAGRSASTSDKASFFVNGGFVSAWLYSAGSVDPTKAIWVLNGDSSLANIGDRIVAPGEGLFVKSNRATSMIVGGCVRTNAFAQVVRPGSTLLALPWPRAASPTLMGFNTTNGFIASRLKTTADQLLTWRADTPGGPEAYSTFWYALISGASRWVSAEDASLTDLSGATLLQPNRAFFLKRSGTTTTTAVIPAP